MVYKCEIDENIETKTRIYDLHLIYERETRDSYQNLPFQSIYQGNNGEDEK